MSDNEPPRNRTPLIPRATRFAGTRPLGAGRREHAPPSSEPPLPSEPGEGVGGEGELWREALPAIADRLREIGYDIASSQSSAPPGGSIVARRDLGDRVVVLAIDVGGWFRAELTWVVGEWPSQDEIAGVTVRIVDAVWRAVTVTAQLPGPEQVIDVVTGLATIASWADVAATDTPPALT